MYYSPALPDDLLRQCAPNLLFCCMHAYYRRSSQGLTFCLCWATACLDVNSIGRRRSGGSITVAIEHGTLKFQAVHWYGCTPGSCLFTTQAAATQVQCEV